jgi:hypothetical protein
MAKEQKSTVGWLERKRERKREKIQQTARRSAEKRANQAGVSQRSGSDSMGPA